jgi:putative membrane protein
MIIRFILRALVAALGLWIAARYIHGISYASLESLIAAAFVLGLVNAIVRPIVILLTLPFTLITLGLFLIVINALMLELVALFIHDFRIGSFWDAILGSLVVSLISWVGSWVIHRPEQQRAG